MKHKATMIATTCSLTLASGSTLAAPHDEGTIDVQRTKLQSYAASTGGWMSTQTTPRFWAWKLHADITDFSKTSPYMNPWIHVLTPSNLVDSSGTIDTTKLQTLATDIANAIIANSYAGGDYAIFIQNWARNTRLSQSAGDDLVEQTDDMSNTLSWSSHTNGRHTGNTATPWRSEGLADTYGDNLAALLINQIIVNVLADPGYATFPKPARVFFDEEFAPGIGCHIEQIAVLMSIANDSRFTSETLYGNFDLWDPTPANTTADELFYDADLTDMPNWIPAYFDEYTVRTAYNLTACNCSMQAPFCCPQPCWDHEFFPIWQRVSGMLSSARDGLIQAGFGDAIDSIWGSDVLWSNYDTSVWYSETYPHISNGDRGARYSDIDGVSPYIPRDDQRWGRAQLASSGSGDMHAPVLYPPYWSHQNDTLADTDTTPSSGNEPETYGEAWLRTARMQMDHAIFSLDEFDTLDSGLSPKRFSPWVLTVGTYVIPPNTPAGNTSATTKENVRNIVALCKSKGANELIFWADPGSSGHQNGKQNDWDATNDVLSQVYDYNLTSVVVNPSASPSPNSTALEAMLFAEEHAFDVPALLTPAGSSTLVHAYTESEFTISNITTDATSYAFIAEIIDGGGPWDGSTYSIAVYNHNTSSFDSVSPTHTEPLSTSTRRAEFSDSDSNDYSDWYVRTFDQQNDLPPGALVTDRKTIHRWDFSLGTPSNYIASGKMKIRLLTSRFETGTLTTADPLRIDLQQLFETDSANDNY